MEQRSRSSSAAMKGVPINLRKEEFAGATEERNMPRNVAMKDVLTMLLKEEYAGGMVPRSNSVATITFVSYVQLKGVATNQFKEECVESMAQNPRYADMRDVPTKSRKEEFV